MASKPLPISVLILQLWNGVTSLGKIASFTSLLLKTRLRNGSGAARKKLSMHHCFLGPERLLLKGFRGNNDFVFDLGPSSWEQELREVQQR